ncbi:DUF1569 domain-containing protein [Polaribacter sp.]|nr:DUF1569 domain-containing protein [Polaribacter sp.]
MHKREMTALENSLKRLESYLPNLEQQNLKISKANIAWQLDHSLKVFNGVATVLQESDPKMYVDNFSLVGKILLRINFIPRGKAKVPKYLASPETISKESLIAQLALAKTHLAGIEKLDENAFFKHPLFGNVNKTRALRFLKVHTHHHLKIVKAILK